MATFRVTSPDGKTYEITAPDGATPEQVKAFAMQKFQPAEKPAYNPTDDMGPLDRGLAGVGMGMARTGRAVGQMLGLVSQEDIDYANSLDKPLANTTAGKVGNVVGTAAAVAPAMLIPGANTYTGAALIGAGTGAATTEGGLKDRAIGAATGALGGLAGKGAGDLIGAGASRLSQAYASRQAAKQVENAGRDAAVSTARGAGYTLPPTEINPSVINNALEGLSGKIKTSQSASAKNQGVTNSLAKKALGLPDDAPITIDALNNVRNAAGQAYEAVSVTGQVRPTQAYDQALDSIVAPFKKAAAGFPNGKPNPIISEIESLRSPEFDAGAAIAKIRELRADADARYVAGNKDAGKALKDAAKALEDAIDTHLQTIQAPPGMLDAFREARKLIAKTYTVQKGLNAQTGNVAAGTLAKDLAKGKPLSGELRTIAEVGSAFPKATQALPQNYNALSPLDYAMAFSTGNPFGLVARPGLRAGILSKPYQSMVGESYGPNRLVELINATTNNNALRRMLPAATAANLLPAEQ